MEAFEKEIYGQQKAVNSLIKIYNSGKIPHAFLFTGREGSGKFSAAFEFIKLLSSNNPLSIKPISNLSEPHIKLIYPVSRSAIKNTDEKDSSSGNDELKRIREEIEKKKFNPYHRIAYSKNSLITIEKIREINKFISLSFEEIGYRVILILDAHLMNVEAQNALLKNLEEPPEGVIFILITSKPENLLTTINSRCWQIRFSSLKEEDVSKILIEHFEQTEDTARKIAPFSQGELIKALDILNYDVDQLTRQSVSFLRYALAKKYSTAYKIFENEFQGDQLKVRLFFHFIFLWLYNVRSGLNDGLLNGNNEFFETAEKFRKKDIDELALSRLMSIIDKSTEYLDKNVGLNMMIMNVIFEIGSII